MPDTVLRNAKLIGRVAALWWYGESRKGRLTRFARNVFAYLWHARKMKWGEYFARRDDVQFREDVYAGNTQAKRMTRTIEYNRLTESRSTVSPEVQRE